jgi:hypothetical protein
VRFVSDTAIPNPTSQDADVESLTAMISDLVKAGLMTPEHQLKIIQLATAAVAKIDELRQMLDLHFQGRTILDAPPSRQPARQQVIDSVSSTVLNINRIQSTFSSLSDPGQDAAQKAISIILGRLMAVLDDFKKHVQYQSWAVSFTGGIPPSLQVGVQITFQ